MIVNEIDNVHIHITAELSILYELSEYFAFHPTNYQWSPLYKNKVWDGKIRLFKINPQTLYRGLIPQLQVFAYNRGYTIDFEGDILQTNNISLNEAAIFVKGLNLPFTPHQHQLEAFVRVARDNRATILAATASGKSLITYMLTRWFNIKTLLIVTKKGLATQLYNDFADYGWDPDKYVHLAAAGVEKTTDKLITITTWQGIYKQPKKFFDPYKMVIGDEAHHYDAKSMVSIMEKMSNAKVRVTMTGTLEDSKAHELVIQGLFGPIYQPATNKQLSDRGVIAVPDIKVIMLKHTVLDCTTQRKVKDYKKEREFIITHCKRNEFICNLALSLKGNTLILYRFVELQGRPLFEQINRMNSDGRQIFYIDRNTTTAEREQIRAAMETQTDAIIVASTGTFAEGANIPTLNNAIMATPVKSKITVLQSIGRLLRTTADKNSAVIYDIVDDLSVGQYANYTLAHALIRIGMYKKSQYDYKTYRVQL